MAEVDDVRDRLRDDPQFRRDVAENPRRSLEPYELNVDDLRVLADDVVAEPGLGPVEQRTRRAAFFQLLVDRRDPLGAQEGGIPPHAHPMGGDGPAPDP